jgi:hypothetical protein
MSDGEREDVGSPVNEALKFLVHFIGDLHMPLHLAGRERGGNGIHVLFDGRQTSKCFFISPCSFLKYDLTVQQTFTVSGMVF